MIIQNTTSFFMVFLASIVLSLIVVFTYKLTTNQEEMKKIKDEMKELQKKIKENKNDQKKVLELNSELLKLNSEYMHKSLKTSFYTFIPAMLVLWFLYSFVASAPIYPAVDFSIVVTFNKSFDINSFNNQNLNDTIILPEGFKLLDVKVKGKSLDYLISSPEKEGEYNFTFIYNNQTFVKKVVVSKTRSKVRYSEDYDGIVKNIKVNDILVKLPFWPYYLSWLWVYILLSIPFNSFFRKIFNIH